MEVSTVAVLHTLSQPEELVYAPDHLRDSIFSNDVFWKLLGQHLNFADLKDCRLVSRKFNQKILSATDFNTRALVFLNADNLKPENFGSTTLKWKNIFISTFDESASDPPVDFDWLYSYLSDVGELYVHLRSRRYLFGNRTCTPLPALSKLLEATKSLKKLSLDLTFLSRAHASSYTFSAEAIKSLENVTELELTSSGRPRLLGFNYHNLMDWFQPLAGGLKNLKVVRTEGALPEISIKSPSEWRNIHKDVQNLLQIFIANRWHLESLQLNDMQFWHTTKMPKMLSLPLNEFPSLHSAQIRVKRLETENIMKFLRQQPPLQELDIYVWRKFPLELFHVIAEKSRNLNRLCIRAKNLEGFDLNSWAFLGEMSNLKEFSLHLFLRTWPSSNINLLESVLLNVPLMLQKIRVRCLRAKHFLGAPQHTLAIVPGTLAKLNPNTLTELSISRCGNSIGDQLLEFIFRNFRLLRILNISDTGTNCTDYGFTGLPRPSEGNGATFSVSNLLGLKKLTLRSCGAITDATLVHGIKIKELFYLDVSKNPGITVEGCRSVLEHNPCLEVLEAFGCKIQSSVPIFQSMEEWKTQFRHLKRIEFFDDDGSDDSDNASEGGDFSDMSSDFHLTEDASVDSEDSAGFDSNSADEDVA